MSHFTTTISAISTPPGKGGVAVIRISGQAASEICEKIFAPFGKLSPMDKPRCQIYGKILRAGEEIDDGLACFFPCPNSYTGEDILEISCHGGSLITRMVLEATYIAGAVAAEAGEFTKRAFINGKLSLTDADAIGLLLEAQSEGQVKLAKSSARERLTERTDAIRVSITELLSSIYARIDYPEEDLGELSEKEILDRLTEILSDIDSLLSTYKTGRAIREGISTAIVGSPNAGKSTLYNMLTGEDLAIVTDVPGTTRDVLERNATLGNVLLRLADTAGIRSHGADRVEEIGISRSKDKAADAELIFALFDGSKKLTDEDYELIDFLLAQRGEIIAIITKTDIADKDALNTVKDTLSAKFSSVIAICALSDEQRSISAITELVTRLFTDEKIVIGDDAIISSAKQHASLLRAKDFILNAISAYRAGLPQDVSSSDIELALGAVSEIDGRAVSEEVVADIFSKFCVGK